MLRRASGKLLRKHTRNPRRVQRHMTYSWTAAFVLRASFAIGKAGVGAYRAKSRLVAHPGRMEQVGA